METNDVGNEIPIVYLDPGKISPKPIPDYCQMQQTKTETEN